MSNRVRRLVRPLAAPASFLLCFAVAPVTAQEPAAVSMFSFELEIDARDAPFVHIADLALLTDGRVCVLDAGAASVRVFATDGAFLGAFGERGAGPGLLDGPTALRVVRDTLHVLEPSHPRVTRFSSDGLFLGVEPLLPPADLVLAHPVRLLDGRFIARSIHRAARTREERDSVTRVVLFRPGEPRSELLTSIAASPVVWFIPDQRDWGGEPSPFGEGGAWALSGDSLLAVVDGYTGEVRFLRVGADGLRRGRTVVLGARGRAITARDLQQLQVEIEARRGAALPRSVQFITPPQWSVVTGRAFFSDGGDLWLERNEATLTRALWTRVDARTGEVRNFVFPAQFTLYAVAGALHYGVWSQGERQTVRIYRSTA